MKNRMWCLMVSVMLVVIGVSIVPVLAAPLAPSIKVNAVWRPATQLTTIDVDSDGQTDSGDDIRYAVADIYATTTVEFWAVGFVCTVNKSLLETYTLNGDPNSLEDDVAMLVVGAAWTQVTQHAVNTTDTDGKINFAISVLADSMPPMGSNGVSETLHIATLKYRVREGLTAAGTSPFTCTTNFVNEDGKKVVAASYAAPPALSILPGYTFTGKATYQGITTTPTAAQAIDVVCDDSDGDAIFDDVVTTANVTSGLFTVSNLRVQGRYECRFFGNIRAVGQGFDQHLMGFTDFNLTTSSYALLPVVLRNGNVMTTSSSGAGIDNLDLVMITGNWNAPLSVLTAPYMLGDANGDRKINDVDLALVAGNYSRQEPYQQHHLIYSLPRDNTVFQNSHLWLGNLSNARVNPFMAVTNRDYWPAVSPDGKKLAFIRNVGTGLNERYALFTAPITNGVVGTAKRLTPTNATYDAFAPSWSPDGTQIAFVCSYNQDWLDATEPHGYLCLIEAGGLNFRLLPHSDGTPILSKLQAAAWANSHKIYFAWMADLGDPNDDHVRVLDFATTNGHYASLVAPLSDMPYVRQTPFGLTLLYRTDDGAGNRKIVLVQIGGSTNQEPSTSYPSTTSGFIHDDVRTSFPAGSAISTSVDYYTVSMGGDPDIVFYTSNSIDTGGRTYISRFFTGTSTAPAWGGGFTFTVADAVSNPGWASGYNAALRNTVVFLP